MQQSIDITTMGPHTFGVRVTEGQDTTSHRVTVSEQLADDLGVIDLDEELAVRESFSFLLEREPVDAIRKEFDLCDIRGYFPEYYEELRTRLAV